MIYDKFKAKIDKFTAFLRVLKRFRILILSILGAILLVTGSLLATKGIIHGEINCPQVIYYGQSFSLDSEAFMSDVTYEYRSEDGDWTSKFPTEPGTYYVRAVADAAFGTKRYNHETEFVIRPKAVTVSVVENTLQYGQLPSISGEFLEGDSATFNVQYIGLNTESVQIQPINVQITNKDGEDVTHCYSITAMPTPVSLTKAPITIQITDATHVYDGKEFSSTDYEIIDGALLFGDEVTATFDGATVLNAGEQATNTATFAFTNLAGETINDYYEITTIPGTISVTKRPLFIEAESGNKTYDGTPLTGGGYKVGGDTSLADGQEFGAIQAASITTVGEIINTPSSLQIIDAVGNDVSGNYEIEYSQESSLVVTKRPLAVASGSKTTMYDGNPLRHEEANYDGYTLGDGDTIAYTFNVESTVTNVTEQPVKNLFTVSITNKWGENVTYCYGNDDGEIAYTYGELSRTKRTIKVNSRSPEWTYDGEEHSDADQYSATDMDIDEVNFFSLVDGHTLKIVKANTSIQFIWDNGMANDLTFGVLNGWEDVSGNYDIDTSEKGTLTILQRNITIQTHSHQWTYDGLEHSDEKDCNYEGGATNVLINGTTLGKDDYFAIVTSPALTVGDCENDIVFDIKKTAYTGENDIKANYNIEQTNGTIGMLEILQRPILVRSHSCDWLYDGLEHRDGEEDGCTYSAKDVIVNAQNPYGLLDGHTLKLVETHSSIKNTWGLDKYNPQSVRNIITVIVVYSEGENAGKEVVYVNDYGEAIPLYKVSYDEVNCGILTITPRPITITTGSKNWTYDGDAHSWTEDDKLTSGTLVSGQYIQLIGNPVSITNFGEIANENRYSVTDGNEDLTDNYKITPIDGELSISKREIIITTPSGSWTYDGDLHTQKEGAFADNLAKYWHELVLNEESVTYVRYVDDNCDNKTTFKVYDGYTDISQNYDIVDYIYGRLEITPCNIEIQAHNCEWVYDGKDHQDCDGLGFNTYTYSNSDAMVTKQNGDWSKFPTNNYLEVTKYTTIEATNVEKLEDNVLEIVLLKSDGTPVPANNYTMNVLKGTLYIHKAPITITSNTAVKVYDGTPLTDNGFTYTTAVENHTVEVDVVGTITQYVDGGVANTIDEESLKITNAAGEDVTHCFVPEFVEQRLYIEKARITITANSNTKMYDATELTDDGFTHKFASEMRTEHTVEATVEGSQLNAGYSDNVITDWAVLNEKGENVNHCFKETLVKGKLTVTKRPIKINSHSLSWTYDGVEHKDGDADTDGYTQEDDMTIEEDRFYPLALTTHEIRLAWAPVVQFFDDTKEATYNHVVFTIYDGTEYVTDNYEIDTSDKGTLKINPRFIYIDTHDCEWTYDGLPHKDGQAGTESYKASDVKPHTDEETGIEYLSFPEMDKLQIADANEIGATNVFGTDRYKAVNNQLSFTVWHNGRNVTNCYSIKVNAIGKLQINKANITLTAASDEKVYDDTPLTKDGFSPVTYKNGHTITATVNGSQTNVGSSYNVIDQSSVVINHPTHGTVTDCFIIACNKGTLTVTQRPITIKTGVSGDISWMYDGYSYSNTTYEVDNLVDGHGLSRTSIVYVLNVKDTYANNNKNQYKVMRGGTNVTDNYKINYVYGTLTITPRPIRVVTKDYDFGTYDGLTHQDTRSYSPTSGTYEGVYYNTMARSQTLKIETATAIRYTWESNTINTLTFTVVGTAYQNNYDIRVDNVGKLTLSKARITLSVNSGYTNNLKQRAYNGTPLYADKSHNLSSAMTNRHDVTITLNVDSIINAETKTVSIASYTIVNKETGENVNECFTVTKVSGSLKITPKQITISKTHDCTWYYDGKAHYDGDGVECINSVTYTRESYHEEYKSYIISTDLDDGWKILPAATPATIPASATSSYTNRISFAVMKDGEKNDNYSVTASSYGTLRILSRNITIKALDQTKTYDGETFTLTGNRENVDYAIVSGTLPTGYSIKVTYTSDIIAPGTTQDYKLTYKLFDNNGNDVTSNTKYIISVSTEKATITVTQRAVSINLNKVTYTYDGTEKSILANDVSTCTVSGLLDGHTLSITSSGAKGTNAGTYPNTLLGWVIKDENGVVLAQANNVEPGIVTETGYYSVIHYNNDLVINQRALTITIPNKTVTYNGNTHSIASNDYTYTGLANGHELTFTTTGVSGQKPGVYNVRYDVDSIEIQSVDTSVKDNYKISVSGGTLTINKIQLSITTGDGWKKYDGGMLTSGTADYGFVTGGAVAGHEIIVTATGSQTDVGTSANTYTIGLKINGVDANFYDYYEIVSENLGDLTVDPHRQLVLAAKSESRQYDGTPLTANGYEIWGGELQADHRIIDVVCEGSITEVGTQTNKLVSYKIVDANGNDVKKYYELSEFNGTLTITKADITVTAGTASKTYDGTPLTCSTYSPATWKNGHVVKATMTADSTITDFGTKANVIETVVITNADGKDVTHCFNVYKSAGLLHISAVRISISSASGEHTYNGAAFARNNVDTDYSVTYIDKMPSASSLSILPDAYATRTLVGNTLNTFTYEIWENGEQVTGYKLNNYYVTSDYGTLTVLPRTVMIHTPSDYKPFDGTPLVNKNYTVSGMEGMATPHTYDIEVIGSITEWGTTPNEVDRENVRFYNEKGINVTTCFDVQYDLGTLEITLGTLKIVPKSVTREYDGTPLTAGYTVEGLLTRYGHTLDVTTNGSQTFVGETENNVASYLFRVNGVEEDITKYYTLEIAKGTLKVTPRSIIVDASGSWTYDGEEHYATYADVYREDGEIAIANGDRLEADLSTLHRVVNVGKVYNTTEYRVWKGNDEVSENYDIEYVGELEITPALLTIISLSDSKEYDGTPLTAGYNVWGLYTQYGHELVVEMTGGQTNVGASKNTFTYTFYVNGVETDINTYYVVDTSTGELSVRQREILVDASGSWLYDGNSHFATEVFAYREDGKSALVNGDKLEEILSTRHEVLYVTDSAYNTTKYNVVNNGKVVTDNYDITYVGYLEIMPLPLTIKTASDWDYYNEGYTFSNPQAEAIGLIDGHVLENLYANGKIWWVGTTANTVAPGYELYVNGEYLDVEKIYDVEEELGILELIENAEIPEEEKSPLDGMYVEIKPVDIIKHISQVGYGNTLKHTNEIEYIGWDALTAMNDLGFTYKAIVAGELTGAGVCDTYITSFVVYDSAMNIVYDSNNLAESVDMIVVFEEGIMEITEKYLLEISLVSSSATYDGKPHTYLEAYKLFDLDLPTPKYTIIGEGNIGDIRLEYNEDKMPSLTNVYDEVSDAQWREVFTVYNQQGEDITNKCAMAFIGKGLTIKQRNITITADSVTKEYVEGMVLACATYSANPIKGHRVEAVTSGSISMVGSTLNIIESYKIFDANNNDVTKNYNVTTVNGILELTK